MSIPRRKKRVLNDGNVEMTPELMAEIERVHAEATESIPRDKKLLSVEYVDSISDEELAKRELACKDLPKFYMHKSRKAYLIIDGVDIEENK